MSNINVVQIDIHPKYIPMFYDLLRIFIIQFITQFLVSLSNPSIKLFNYIFLKNTMFILISVVFYWVIVKNLILLKSIYDIDTDKEQDYSYIYSI